IQRLMKLSIKRSAHRDLVDEASAQIKAGKAPHEIKLDTTVGTLRDRPVGWIVQAVQDLSDPATIMKAFEMCSVGPWNLSHASITSPAAYAALRDLRATHPALHAELTGTALDTAPANEDTEDDPFSGSDVYD
ncbi:hypothetical protein C8R47DRAFT_926325, partial [Mycena vitilis]